MHLKKTKNFCVFLGSIYGGTEFWCPNGKLKWIHIGSFAE